MKLVRKLLGPEKNCPIPPPWGIPASMQRPPTHQSKALTRSLVLSSIICLVTAIPLPALQPACASQDEVYRYREVTGTLVKNVEWHLHKEDRYTLTYSAAGEKFVTITDREYNTRRWRVITADGETNLTAVRTGNTLSVSGRFKGKPVNRHLDIDDCPWYQATSLSLRGLIDSDHAECIFWTIRFDTLTAHKIKAVKKGVEKLESADTMLHIRLTLPGLLAPFWKSDYWFALPQGVFHRFQGPSGPPGSPVITITRTAG